MLTTTTGSCWESKLVGVLGRLAASRVHASAGVRQFGEVGSSISETYTANGRVIGAERVRFAKPRATKFGCPEAAKATAFAIETTRSSRYSSSSAESE